jgi:KUP system potassium uptake protein
VIQTTSANPAENKHSLAFLVLAALGVVFGDIGTSPLYAIRFCFDGDHAISITQPHVFGVLSLIFWTLIIIISVKYLLFVLRADNRGEGGILALMAILQHGRKPTRILTWVAVFGAALLYGDGMITPAISVLSAVEGFEVVTHAFEPWVVPITIAILLGIFYVQSHGTARVGAVFGPITFIWFVVLGILGFVQILKYPDILAALNPVYGIQLLTDTGWTGFMVLGAVFFVVTGGEALYADMGHFGRRPIRIVWFGLVLPALMLNYLGQGALLLQNPDVRSNPFFNLAPQWALIPLVILATMATIIASQAVITGVFSLTMQAVQLGYLPRMQIEHTSAKQSGQIYIPIMNWMIMMATVGLVLAFRSSENLAAAYGVAVSTTMVITTLLLLIAAIHLWKWPPWAAVLVTSVFFIIDFGFLATNMLKFAHGGWFPLLIACGVFTAMTTWKTGRQLLREKFVSRSSKFEVFQSSLLRHMPLRVPGTAVFMTSNATGVPPALLHNLHHNRILHDRVVLLTLITDDLPYVSEQHRLSMEDLGMGFHRVIARHGFMEEPIVPAVLDRCAEKGLQFNIHDTTFFLGLESIVSSHKGGMMRWREKLFILMVRNAQMATHYFHLPSNRVVVVGVQVEM